MSNAKNSFREFVLKNAIIFPHFKCHLTAALGQKFGLTKKTIFTGTARSAVWTIVIDHLCCAINWLVTKQPIRECYLFGSTIVPRAYDALPTWNQFKSMYYIVCSYHIVAVLRA